MSNNTIYTNLLGCLIKKGKKNIAKALLAKALNIVSSKYRASSSTILRLLSANAGTPVELRAVKYRRNTINVPFPVKVARRRFLLSRHIISSAHAIDRRYNFSEKLGEKILSILINKNARVNQQTLHATNIIKSRSNTHFRW